MGLSFKIFDVKAEDTVVRFPLTQFNRLLRRDPNERRTQYANKRILVALMAVERIDQKPVAILILKVSWILISVIKDCVWYLICWNQYPSRKLPER